MFAGLIAPSSGTLAYDGRQISGPNFAVGYMAQQDNLLPWRTLAKNVGLPLELRGVNKKERAERVDRALRQVGLSNKDHYYPSQLSGGMRKRAALARTLVYDPQTLLLDEPFGAIDAQLKMALHSQLLQVCEERKTTVVFVTHDLEEALLMGDRIVVFSTNPGRIVHTETVPFSRPRNIFELRASPDFWALWKQLWTHLGSELPHDN
jgi:NitT/TauT family transport system ATP-binding protein